MLGRCKLCGQEGPLCLGHIFPHFAVKWLKRTSATGYLRDLSSSRRLQESKREYILCRECEQRLGRDEKKFCELVFLPCHGRNQQSFQYGPWFRRFLAGLHWKVLVTRDPAIHPESAERIYDEVEVELRQFLLEESATPGRAEFHAFFADVVQDATPPIPPKANWYLVRALDATPTFSESGTVGCYVKLLRLITYAFLTPRDSKKEEWKGTKVFDQGEIRSPQEIRSAGLGPFLTDRMKALEQGSSRLTPRQFESLLEQAKSNPNRFLLSESYRVHKADRELRQRQGLQTLPHKLAKGRDRNKPCICGSGRKFKKCCGRLA